MHKIALMPGDGIGPEITAAAVEVIEAAGVHIEWVKLDVGEVALRKTGSRLPDEALEIYMECRLDPTIVFKMP